MAVHEDDLTGKIQQAVHEETSKPLASLEKKAKSIKFFVGLLAATFVAGGCWTVYAMGFAKAEVVEKLSSQTLAIAADLAEHKKIEEQRLSEIKDNQKRTEDDYHLLLRQTMEIARSTGARQLKLPEHMKED